MGKGEAGRSRLQFSARAWERSQDILEIKERKRTLPSEEKKKNSTNPSRVFKPSTIRKTVGLRRN